MVSSSRVRVFLFCSWVSCLCCPFGSCLFSLVRISSALVSIRLLIPVCPFVSLIRLILLLRSRTRGAGLPSSFLPHSHRSHGRSPSIVSHRVRLHTLLSSYPCPSELRSTGTSLFRVSLSLAPPVFLHDHNIYLSFRIHQWFPRNSHDRVSPTARRGTTPGLERSLPSRVGSGSREARFAAAPRRMINRVRDPERRRADAPTVSVAMSTCATLGVVNPFRAWDL